jgi:oligopeptidase A
MSKFNLDILEEIPNQLQILLDKNKEEIASLLIIENKTYDNFVLPYQLINEELDVFITPTFHLDSVCNSELTQDVYGKCLPILSEYGTWIGQNEDLFSAFKQIDQTILTPSQQKVCQNEIRDFSLTGCGLDSNKKDRLKELNLTLSELSKEFSQNLLDATNSFEMVIDCIDDVKEIPASDLENAKFDDNGQTKWKFTLQMPSYLAYITYGTSRSKREEIYKAYCTRAPQNEDIIDKILAFKNEKVKLLGFDNYSQYSLSTKMASSEDAVINFLYKLSTHAKDQAKVELNDVKELAKKLDNIEDFNSYDMAYYGEKLKKEQYDIDEELYRPYFEQKSVVDGLFDFLLKLLNIEFREVSNADKWHEKTLVYDIYEDNIKKSRIYLDLEARKEKRGGAWMNNWHTRYKANDKVSLPTAFVVCNFPQSTESSPSLLRHSDVVTLFHEMGHALHHLLSTVDEPFVSGINGVAWDVVEFPSQFLEYFSYDKDVLKMFAKHYETKEVIGDDMIDKLIKAKNFQSSLATLRQVEFALFDFKLHQNVYKGKEVQDLLDSIREEVSVSVPPKYNKFQNGFAHIFGGGYAAGYYSYKWAEVLSADAFMLFIENGTFNEELSSKYKELILGKGGSCDMNELYYKLANREPDVKSLLKIDGIM